MPLAKAQTIDLSSQATPRTQTFTITAYYSPLPGQKRYLRGSLQGDLRLNGNGTNGADGTEVYPGMIAAPKSYAFGTKMYIEGIGTVAVHDRGGAIKASGESRAFDRLDIWMGKGDEGLTRALNWGKRNVTVKVYGIDDSMKENVDFSSFRGSANTFASQVDRIFLNDLSYGDQNDQVKTLQESLKKLNYYNEEINGKFDDVTREAVIKFQIDTAIIDERDDFGTGFLGPQTRNKLEKALNGDFTKVAENKTTSIIPTVKAAPLRADDKGQNSIIAFANSDLKLGDSGPAVTQLQNELRNFNLFALEQTGYYGEMTQHAVFKFQQSTGLVGDINSTGAGNFGTKTRAKMTELIKKRLKNDKLIAETTAKAKFVAVNQ